MAAKVARIWYTPAVIRQQYSRCSAPPSVPSGSSQRDLETGKELELYESSFSQNIQKLPCDDLT
eukprot:gene188-11049_t